MYTFKYITVFSLVYIFHPFKKKKIILGASKPSSAQASAPRGPDCGGEEGGVFASGSGA